MKYLGNIVLFIAILAFIILGGITLENSKQQASIIKANQKYITELEEYSTELYEYYNATINQSNAILEQNKVLFKSNYFLEAENLKLKQSLSKRFDYSWTGCNQNNPDWVFTPNGKYYLECSKSMRPTIACNHRLYFCKIKGGDDINIGDIILFKSPEYDIEYTIHRVVRIRNGKLITKGDNNPFEDTYPLELHQVEGKLYKIEA